MLLENLKIISDPKQFYQLDKIRSKSALHFYWKDKNGEYLGCNDAQAHVVGLNKGLDLLGATDFDLPWKTCAPLLRKNDQAVMLTKKPKIAIEPITLEQKTIFVFSYKTPLYSARKKRISGIIGASFQLDQEAIKLIINPSVIQKTSLTTRQTECLYYLVKGMTLKQIGKTLNLSPKTIEHYLQNIKVKLHCETRAELIRKALALPEIQGKLAG